MIRLIFLWRQFWLDGFSRPTGLGSEAGVTLLWYSKFDLWSLKDQSSFDLVIWSFELCKFTKTYFREKTVKIRSRNTHLTFVCPRERWICPLLLLPLHFFVCPSSVPPSAWFCSRFPPGKGDFSCQSLAGVTLWVLAKNLETSLMWVGEFQLDTAALAAKSPTDEEFTTWITGCTHTHSARVNSEKW